MFVSSVSFFCVCLYLLVSRDILVGLFVYMFVCSSLPFVLYFVCLFVCLLVLFSLPSLFRYVQLCACFLRLYSLVESARPYVLPSDGTEEIA